MKEELTPETIKYIKETELDHRKSLGQYFTPESLRNKLISYLPKRNGPKVLDPGSGTGEFLLSAKKYFNNPDLHGWEIDKKLVKISRELVPDAKIKHTDTLKEIDSQKYDFVIGNPPYYEFRPNEELRKKYSEVINGRVNIYGLFVYKGIRLLKEGGYLAYVVPPSMNNGAYFSKLRKHIVKQCNIEHMQVQKMPNIFHKALQSVMLLVLKKGPNQKDYIFKKNGVMIFSSEADYLKKVFNKGVALCNLGYKVRTGKLVWNENKDLLTNKEEEGVTLIWSHNITEQGLNLNNNKKPQFIKTKDYDIGPAVVVNRIVGRPGKGKIKAAFIPKGMKFVGENHVNVITPSRQTNLIDLNHKIGLKEILNQLNTREKTNILQSVTGNTQISKNELEKLFPFTP